MPADPSIDAWFLSPEDRGNPSTELDRRRGDGRAFTIGNQVDVIVHGAPYFEQLHRALSDTQRGDTVHFADWRGDPDQFLVDGVEFASLLAELAERGVAVRGLVWRSHPKATGFHLEHHVELADKVNDAGGLILLDQRVRPAASHHQKLVVIRYAGEREEVAFLGGSTCVMDDETTRGMAAIRNPRNWTVRTANDLRGTTSRYACGPGLGGSRSCLPRTVGRPDTDGRPANAVAGDDLQARQTAGAA